MVLDFPGEMQNLFKTSPEDNQIDKYEGKRRIPSTAADADTGASPVGTIVGWLKSFTNTPSIPAGWVECNGQTLGDAGSVYNGQVIPNLNGDNRFLRGNATSGGTGGSETHNHKWVHAQTVNNNLAIDSTRTDQITYNADGSVKADKTGGCYTDKISTHPTYYEVVWIMRVK